MNTIWIVLITIISTWVGSYLLLYIINLIWNWYEDRHDEKDWERSLRG